MDQQDVMVNEPPQKKGGGWLKWTLIGCGGLLVLGAIVFGIVAYFLYKNASMSNDPATVQAMAEEILPFDKPEGFTGVMSGSMLGWKMAMLSSSGSPDLSKGGIMLMSIPVAMSSEQAEAQLRDAIKRQGGVGGQNEVKEHLPSETFKVRGEDVAAQVAVLGDGTPRVLQYTLTLKGPSGLVLMTIAGPEDEVNHEWVQNLLNTVR